MNKIIKLTDAIASTPIYYNVGHIIWIYREEINERTVLKLNTNITGKFYVKETPEEIQKLIEG